MELHGPLSVIWSCAHGLYYARSSFLDILRIGLQRRKIPAKASPWVSRLSDKRTMDCLAVFGPFFPGGERNEAADAAGPFARIVDLVEVFGFGFVIASMRFLNPVKLRPCAPDKPIMFFPRTYLKRRNHIFFYTFGELITLVYELLHLQHDYSNKQIFSWKFFEFVRGTNYCPCRTLFICRDIK